MDFVILIECESAFRPTVVWDSGKAYWLCQMNSLYHNIPIEYQKDWWYQINYCYDKWKNGTTFYWPSRILSSWKKCYQAVQSRFSITPLKW